MAEPPFAEMSAPTAVPLAAETPRVRVGLVQINYSFSGRYFLPYPVALLQAYVEKFAREPGRFEFKPPVYKRRQVGHIVESLVDADVVGFSTYIWNGRISLEVARRLKERNDDVIVVFGGPHVPDNAEEFLRRNPFIDIAVHNEGERAFLALLEQYPAIHATAIDGTSFITADGVYRRMPNAPRIRDLDGIPSPFLSGAFDRLMADNPGDSWIGLWETNRGCPFQCTFCDWGSAIATKVNKFGFGRLTREIDWFSERGIEFIYCCDANFGILGRDIDIATYVADKKRATGYPQALWVQGTKNATDRAYRTQKILFDAGLSKGEGVGLALQSLDRDTLVNIKRENISVDTYFELQRRFARDSVETYAELILGLPGETYRSFADGTSRIIEGGQHNRIRFNNLSILPNSEMGDPAYLQRYGIVTVESKSVLPGQHGRQEDDVDEVQNLVISTAAMPAPEWRRARVFAWMTALLHFDRLMQIPLIVAHELSGISYRTMIELVMDADTPLLAEIRDFFLSEAASIQSGGPEHPFSAEWLGMCWPTDEYAFIKIIADGKLSEFFFESTALLKNLIASHGGSTSFAALDEAVMLNYALIRQPFAYDDVAVTTSHDIIGFYRAVLAGERTRLRRVPTTTHIERSKTPYDDFQTWCRREDYFYGYHTTEQMEDALIGEA